MNSEDHTKAAIVIPVFNRRETSLECLRNLQALGVPSWARVFLVDDASTDGTAEAVRTHFPEVEIIPGDGNLWWSGGINRGTEAALAWGADYIFWLNDDCFPRAKTFEMLLEVSRQNHAITVPTTLLMETGTPGWGKERP